MSYKKYFYKKHEAEIRQKLINILETFLKHRQVGFQTIT